MDGSPLVEARGLTKRFGDFTAVDAVDFEVRRGEAFGFLGPNGAGKSSTMRMIGAVSPIDAGDLTVFAMDPQTDGASIRARIGTKSSFAASSLFGVPMSQKKASTLCASRRPPAAHRGK